VLTANGKGEGWLASPQDYTDFECEFEFRLPPAGNSGVFVHAWPEGPKNGGRFLEIQLLDDTSPNYTNMGPDKRTGAIWTLVAPQPPPRVGAGQWHRMNVRSAGRRLNVTVDGRQVVAANLDDLAAKSPNHEGVKRTSGRLGLQMLRTGAEFRNVRVRTGGASAAAQSPAGDFAGELAGTTWEVADSDGDRCQCRFLADGVLHYQGDRGPRTNGSWKKTGNAIHIETNNNYATLDGTLTGNAGSGKGTSRNGRSWTWKATLQ
jgi:hypothetical protein